MRPVVGVSIELLVLAAVFGLDFIIPPGLGYFLYVLSAQLLATYLVHCPAHYLVGTAVGIRFRSIRLGRTTLARALPPRWGNLARLIPILTLSTDRPSLVRVSKSKVSTMYLSGTIASSASAMVVAGAVTLSGSSALIVVSWLVAVGYLLFDVVFSPRSGDVMRARAAKGP